MTIRTRSLLVVCLLALLPATAIAGPPLLCWPISTESASLPWGTNAGWKNPLPGYDVARLTPDTLALLNPRAPVLARMETLRRAAIYAVPDQKAITSLLDALRTRAGTPADRASDPLATFDLGYFVEVVRQARHGLASSIPHMSEDGYALIRAALAKRGTDPSMEYAAALVTLPPAQRALNDRHLRAAVQGAPQGSDLARTINAHREMWGDRIESARASAMK